METRFGRHCLVFIACSTVLPNTVASAQCVTDEGFLPHHSGSSALWMTSLEQHTVQSVRVIQHKMK